MTFPTRHSHPRSSPYQAQREGSSARPKLPSRPPNVGPNRFGRVSGAVIEGSVVSSLYVTVASLLRAHAREHAHTGNTPNYNLGGISHPHHCQEETTLTSSQANKKRGRMWWEQRSRTVSTQRIWLVTIEEGTETEIARQMNALGKKARSMVVSLVIDNVFPLSFRAHGESTLQDSRRTPQGVLICTESSKSPEKQSVLHTSKYLFCSPRLTYFHCSAGRGGRC